MPESKRIDRLASIAAAVVLVVIVASMIRSAVLARVPPPPPPIPGAGPEEQRSEVVARGFALGRQYQSTLLIAHGDSWAASANQLEGGMAWDGVRERWASQDRAWRDEPFDRIVLPEIDRILDARPDDPGRRRAATLFLRAFAAGLKDRR